MCVELYSIEDDNGTYKAIYPRIGVVTHEYGIIDKYLDLYNIPYDIIQYRNLENEKTYSKFDVIYFPSGIEKEITASLNILARARKIEGVSSKEDFYRIEDSKLAELISLFVKKGGTAVFSGYSLKFAQMGFDAFELYNKFPNLGMQGAVVIEPQNDLLKYYRTPLSSYMNYEAYWVAADIKNGTSLAETFCPTPYGTKKMVVAGKSDFGKGKYYFLSYTGNNEAREIMRYLTVNILFESYENKLRRLVNAWEQTVVDSAVGKNVKTDISNVFHLKCRDGFVSVYGIFEKGVYCVEIFDEDEKLIFSKNRIVDKFVWSFKNEDSASLTVKIYPQGGVTDSIYSVATASGRRILPYFRKTVISFFSLLVFTVIAVYLRLKKYAGRL